MPSEASQKLVVLKAAENEKKIKGRGLELMLCKIIIEWSRGLMEMKSELEKGTVFLYFLHEKKI